MARPRARKSVDASATLGDSHNFGRRVSVSASAGRVSKPRTIVWERLVLSAESPLRRLLDEAAAHDGLGQGALSFLPDLKFFPSRDGLGGDVELLKLEPLAEPSVEGRRALAQIVGRSLALWSWLGVGDLHWENLALGEDARGNVVLAPLDVELILADMETPTETNLLPEADPEYAETYRHACGVRRALPFLGKPVAASDLVAMAAAYLRALAFLDRRAPAIADVLARLPELREAPIRVCLRGTDEYIRARSGPVWPPLLDAESEQLERGDVPYFFRLYGQKGIHYYRDASLWERKHIPLEGDVPQLGALLPVARGLRPPSRKKLREEGLFTLLGAFDHRSLVGRSAVDGLAVTFKPRTLVVELPSGEELSSKRDLRAFVESVYLPCTCGEVRSVFVPPVTKCRAERRPSAGARTSP